MLSESEMWVPELLCFLSCNCQNVRKKNNGGWETFVSRPALEIQRLLLPPVIIILALRQVSASMDFTNILASIAWFRSSPNVPKLLRNDSKRKENIQKGSRRVLTAQKCLKVLRIESIVPRFLLIPAITFSSQMCRKSRDALPNLEYRSICPSYCAVSTERENYQFIFVQHFTSDLYFLLEK